MQSHQTTEEILKIAKGISAKVGESFFHNLCEQLSKVLKADYAYIAEVLPDKPNIARTLSLIADGNIVDNIEVDLTGTPCHSVLNQNACSFPSGIQTLFPDAHMMSKMRVDGYIGIKLSSSSGKNLGLVSVMYRKPVEDVDFIESSLKIFATRAAAEIERKHYEDELKKAKGELEGRVEKRTMELEKINKTLTNEIKKRRKLEMNILKSEQRFRAVAKSTVDLIWEGDVRIDYLRWYGNIDAILGYEPGEFPHTVSGHMDHVHPADRDNLLKDVEKAVKTGQDFFAEYRIRCKDGSYRYWDERGKPVGFENGKAVTWVGSVTDITERKLSEASLIKSENKFKRLSKEFSTLLDAIPDWLVLLTPHMKILWANKAFAEKVGVNESEIRKKHCYEACCGISSPCNNCPAIKCFKSGREESTQVLDINGRIMDKRAFPLNNEKGKVISVLEVSRDITAKVRMEEEAKRIQERLIQANRMTSLGTLVSGVAHEINNPNSYIMSNVQTLDEIWKELSVILKERHYKDRQPNIRGITFNELLDVIPKLLEGIHDGSVRIRDIVDSLKDFTRPEKIKMDEEVNLNKVIIAARSILDTHIKKYTDHFNMKFSENIPSIKGSARHIEQVIVNLVMNAVQSLTDRKYGVSVSTSYDRKSRYVVIKVKDEGTGIPDGLIQNITEPFFTTRNDIGGTGLGLSISHNIVKEHRGSMVFDSIEGKGTTVTVKLPVNK